MNTSSRADRLFVSVPGEIEPFILSYLDISDFCNARAANCHWKSVCGLAMEKSVLDLLSTGPQHFEVEFKERLIRPPRYLTKGKIGKMKFSIGLAWPEAMDTKEHLISTALQDAYKYGKVLLNERDKAKVTNLLLRKCGSVSIREFRAPPERRFRVLNDLVGVNFLDNVTPQEALSRIMIEVVRYDNEVNGELVRCTNLPLFKQMVVALLANASSAPIKHATYEYGSCTTNVMDFILFKTSDGKPASIAFNRHETYRLGV